MGEIDHSQGQEREQQRQRVLSTSARPDEIIVTTQYMQAVAERGADSEEAMTLLQDHPELSEDFRVARGIVEDMKLKGPNVIEEPSGPTDSLRSTAE